MNPAQHTLYWRLWNACVRQLKASGQTAHEIEATRQRIHFRCGAYAVHPGGLTIKSSKHLNNRDFDQVKAAFLAISQASDLMAQLDQIDQPARRILYAAAELLDQIGIAQDDDTRRAYLAGVARKPLEDCDDADLQRIVIALTHTAQHKRGVPHTHPRTGRRSPAAPQSTPVQSGRAIPRKPQEDFDLSNYF